jgi:hypothetical protein
MPFKKDDSNINRGGRPKGSFSYSAKLRSEITNYCEENVAYFLSEIKAMKTGHAKAQAFLTLLNFALPKLTESNSSIDIESLPDSEIEKMFNKLIQVEDEK